MRAYRGVVMVVLGACVVAGFELSSVMRTSAWTRNIKAAAASRYAAPRSTCGASRRILTAVLELPRKKHAVSAAKQSAAPSHGLEHIAGPRGASPDTLLHACPPPFAVAELNAELVEEIKEGGKDYWLYRGVLLFVAALWGTNFGTVKFVENAHIASSVAAALRFGIAGLAMSPFLRGIKKEELMAGIECGLWISLGYFTQAVGLASTEANKAAFICSLTVVVVPIIQALSGRGIKPLNVAAAAMALAGCGFLELGDAANPTVGDLWALGQPLGFGMAFTRIEHYMEKLPGKSLALTAGQLLTVAVMSLGWCFVDSHGMFPDLSFLSDGPVALALVYTGLVTTALAVLLETVALQHVPATEMSVIFATEPLWATAFAGALLGETLGPEAVGGAALILGACLTAQAPQVMQLLQARAGPHGKKGKAAAADAATLDHIEATALDHYDAVAGMEEEKSHGPWGALWQQLGGDHAGANADTCHHEVPIPVPVEMARRRHRGECGGMEE